jgi:hypothetical protein
MLSAALDLLFTVVTGTFFGLVGLLIRPRSVVWARWQWGARIGLVVGIALLFAAQMVPVGPGGEFMYWLLAGPGFAAIVASLVVANICFRYHAEYKLLHRDSRA